MTTSTVIPEALEEVLLEMSGAINPASSKRWNLRDLAAWLQSEHNLEVSHMAVQRCLTKLRRVRAALTREVLREVLLDSLTDDFASLDEMAAGLREMAEHHRDVKNPKAYVACVGELRKIAATKARIATGVDDEDKVTLSGSANSLAEFLGGAFGGDAPGKVAE